MGPDKGGESIRDQWMEGAGRGIGGSKARNQWGDPGGGAVTHRAIGRQRENFLEGRHRG